VLEVRSLIPNFVQTQVRAGHKADGKRNVVERWINRLKQFRRIATCDEKNAVNYLAMWLIGAMLH